MISSYWPTHRLACSWNQRQNGAVSIDQPGPVLRYRFGPGSWAVNRRPLRLQGDETDDLRLVLHLLGDPGDLVIRQLGVGELDAVATQRGPRWCLDHRGLVRAEELGDLGHRRLRNEAHNHVGTV